MISLEQSHLSDLWQLILRSRRAILLSAAMGLALGALVNVCSRPTYRAAARIEINKASSRSPLTGDVVDAEDWQSDNINLFTAAALLTNKSMLESAGMQMLATGDLHVSDMQDNRIPAAWSSLARRLDFLPLPGMANPVRSGPSSAARAPSHVADWLLAVITIQPIRDTRLVSIQAEHWDPACARRIITTVVNTFMAAEALHRAEANTARVSYLRQQLAIQKERIDQSDQGAIDSPNEGLSALQTRQEQLNTSIASLNDTFLKAKTDRLAVEARLAGIRALTPEQLSSTQELVVQGGSLAQLRQDLMRCETDIARARQIYKEKHPKLIILLSQRASIEADVRRQLKSVIGGLESEHAVLVSREVGLQGAIAQAGAELRTVQQRIASSDTRVSDLRRDRELYGLLLAKIQESEISSAVKKPLAVMVEPATVGNRPVRPRKGLNLALGLVVGCLSGSGFVLMRETMRHRIRTPHDVKEHLQLSVLGMIAKKSA